MGTVLTYVGSVGRDVRKSTLGSNGDQSLLQLLRGDVGHSEGRVLRGLEGEEVGQQTSNVGRGHRGSGDSVDGILAADPGGENVKTGSEDIVALSVVGEVSTLIREGGSTDGDSLLSGSRRVVAGVGIVVTSSDSEVNTSVHSSVHSQVESNRLAATQTHVSSTALEALGLALLGSLDLLGVSSSGPFNALHDVGHGTRTVGSKHLDGVDVGLLGNTVLLTSDRTRAVGTVAIAIDIVITSRDGLTPRGTTLEVNVVGVGASVNDVDVNTLTAIIGIEVFVEGTKAQAVTVGDTGQTPGGVLLNGRVFHRVDFGVPLNVFDLD